MHLEGSLSLTAFSAKDRNEPHQKKWPKLQQGGLGEGERMALGSGKSRNEIGGPTLSLVPGEERQGIFSCLLDLGILGVWGTGDKVREEVASSLKAHRPGQGVWMLLSKQQKAF